MTHIDVTEALMLCAALLEEGYIRWLIPLGKP
jgi:hypothetical protein